MGIRRVPPPEMWLVEGVERLKPLAKVRLVQILGDFGLTHSPYSERDGGANPSVKALAGTEKKDQILPFVEKRELVKLAEQWGFSPRVVGIPLKTFKTHFLRGLAFTKSGRVADLDDEAPWSDGFIPRFRLVLTANGGQVYGQGGNLRPGILEPVLNRVPGVGRQYWDTTDLQAFDINVLHLGDHIKYLPDLGVRGLSLEYWQRACEHFNPQASSSPRRTAAT